MVKKYINLSTSVFFAFNVWNFESAVAVIDASAKVKKAIILQTSTKSFKELNKKCFRSFISEYAKEKNIEVFLHLDHCKSEDLILEAIENDWDSVMVDASDKTLDENIFLTNIICKYAHKKNILVEAEVGHIGGVEDDIVCVENGVANISDVKTFIEQTSVDMLAVAIGTAHGLYKGVPNLHYELLEQIGKFSSKPLVIHGGTGLTDEMFLKLIGYENVKKINISTDVKLAYRNALEKSYKENFLAVDGFDPLNVTKLIHDSVFEMTERKLLLLETK